MRTNKIATIATFLISLLTLIVCAILFNHEPKPFWYDICLACFGSALLGLVVAYSAYSAERRKAMESFWQESLSLINAIRKLKYLNIEEPINLIRDCIKEEYGINFLETNTHKAKNAMIDWLEINKYPDDGNPDYSQRMNLYYSGLIESYTEHLIAVMKTYVDFSQISIQPLMNAYGSMDYIIANHSIRKKVYDNIYRKIEKVHSHCLKESKKLNLAIKGNVHLLDGLDIAIIINDKLYTKKEGDMIFASLADELDEKLEWFRSKIYHVKPEDIKPIPLNYMIDFEKPSPVFERVRKESILDNTSVSPFEPLE